MNTSRIYLEKFVSDAAKKLSNESIVLDAGAGSGPYRNLFSHAKYSSTDKYFQSNKNLSFVSDLSCIPIVDNYYDLIVCTQVLEHVPRPQLVLNELFRVLKPQGELWLSTPFYFEEHEVPFDYFRYTQYGLKYLFETTGFRVDHIDRLEGYYMTLAYQLKMASKSLPLDIRKFGGGTFGILCMLLIIPVKLLFFLISGLFSRLDNRFRITSVGHGKNYTIIGIKPET